MTGDERLAHDVYASAAALNAAVDRAARAGLRIRTFNDTLCPVGVNGFPVLKLEIVRPLPPAGDPE